MATKASGKEFIEHKADILENISKHFNNPDVSDVTLNVGNQEFSAHRFLLSTQSKVFMTMLMGENWKESEEKVITLQESPEAEASFSGFLQFFYTGKLTLTIDNVCGIHTLADKYDVVVLKDDCVSFMKDVLTGTHGDALLAGLKWLQYAESVLQDMVELCYSAIRSNYVQVGFGKNKHRELFEMLSYKQLQAVYSVSEIEKELVCLTEFGVYCIIKNKDARLFKHIRFYNIEMDCLQVCEQECNKYATLKKNLNEAYKIHAERSNIASKGCKRRRLSQGAVEVKCPCEDRSTSPLQCPHMNPRLYLNKPCATVRSARKITSTNSLQVNPVDLCDLEGFAQRLLYVEDTNSCKCRKITLTREYSEDPMFETYTVTPDRSHFGRKFTIAILCLQKLSGDKSEYVIKHTGVVGDSSSGDSFTLISPLRFKGSWELSDHHRIFATVVLHK